MKRRMKVETGADHTAGRKGGGRKTHSGRGKGSLNHDIKGDSVKQTKMAGKSAKPFFGKTPKKPEADDNPGKMRPAAHGKHQAGVAKRSHNLVKRLSHRVI